MPPDTDTESDKTLWFCVRRGGARKQEGWLPDISNDALLRRVGARGNDVVEIYRVDAFRTVAPRRFSRVFYPRVRGLVGIEMMFERDAVALTPTGMIASNLSFDRALERFLGERDIDAARFAADGGLRALSGRQFLLHGDRARQDVELFRGSTLIHPTRSCADATASQLAEGIGRWMVRNLGPKGSLPYKYWPSRGQVSPADNAIRRFLGSLALARLAKSRGGAQLRDGAVRNLRYNLDRYFRVIGNGRGAIVEGVQAKLGAAAVAALAILASPAKHEFHPQLRMLSAGIDSMAHRTLGFRTFFFPPERDGQNWNFYSGEALLFWAESMRQGLEFAPSLERFSEVFARCRARHYRRRNPAFVPWHTQACASVFAHTGRREFADFAFEISDWLLPMQQWEGLPADMRGRFYDPKRPEFGPPHAASTGAYLEGLADALSMARMVGDSRRAVAYGRAVERGVRSLRQLQFRDSRDAFYISRKSRVMGALRTEVYDNATRIDSAAHALTAAIKVMNVLRH